MDCRTSPTTITYVDRISERAEVSVFRYVECLLPQQCRLFERRLRIPNQSRAFFVNNRVQTFEVLSASSHVKSIHKQQTTIRQPIECAPEASSGGREWAEMTKGFHLEATRHRC